MHLAAYPRMNISGKYLLPMLLLLALLPGCRSGEKATPAFYYWKTTWQATPLSSETFRKIKAQKCYLRLCDIGYDPGSRTIVPQDVLRIPEKAALPKAEIIPVIFLEPAALKSLQTEKDITQLSGNIARFASQYCRQQGWEIEEFQLDCDWTTRTAEIYFRLLRALKKEPFFSGKILSVTLRGHQVKYPGKSGIPPADRCMLMAYNMGDIRSLTPENSILDVPTAKDYLQNLSAYPLPLDLALPIFRWTLWYRNGQLLGILRGVDPDALAQYSFLRKAKNANLYTCLADTALGSYRLQASDLLKAESPRPKEVADIAAYATRRFPEKPYAVVFYHLDDANLTRYDTRQLEEILRHCH